MRSAVYFDTRNFVTGVTFRLSNLGYCRHAERRGLAMKIIGIVFFAVTLGIGAVATVEVLTASANTAAACTSPNC